MSAMGGKRTVARLVHKVKPWLAPASIVAGGSPPPAAEETEGPAWVNFAASPPRRGGERTGGPGMDEFRGMPPEPVAPPPRFRWRNIILGILAVALIIFGLARMAGGERGVWGASHSTRGHH